MATTNLVLALDTIKSVEKSLTAVIFNQHQCRRLVDLYSRVGMVLTYLCQSANSSTDDDDHSLLSSLLVTVSALQKGRILIMSYTSNNWVGRLLTTDVNQDSFEAIYVELEGCIQSIYGACQRDLQVKVPKESVMPLLHLSAGDRETLFDMDANKDRTQMGHTIGRRKYTLSQRPSLDPKEIDEVRSLDMVAEKISQGSKSPEPFAELPSYLRIKSEEIIIGDRLGDGGYADVYRCQWMHQNFAVKIFRGNNDADMIKEIYNLIPLRHPNIVQLIGFSVDGEGGRAMLVMELLDCDLSDIIKERVRRVPLKPPFTLSESIDLIHQIAWGMAYLHKKKIFHGDLKSKNVLVAKHPGDLRCYALKISDFGVREVQIQAGREVQIQAARFLLTKGGCL
jgi:tRNA A-37 threonylcarbamoyl transferase component Bud32